MADNILVTPGVGATVAADDIAGALHQRIKLTWGVDGSAVDASASNPLPVTSVVTTLPALAAGTNNIGDVDVLTINGVAPAFGTGVRGATVQRVTIATDDVVPISDNSGSLTVDAPVATPVFVRTSNGSAAIDPGFTAQLPGTLGIKTAANSLSIALASDGTLPLPTGASTAANQSTLNTAIGSSSDAVVANGAAGSIASYLRTIKDAATDTTTASPVKIDQTTPGTTDAVTVKTPADVINYVPTLDTAAYAAGDVLAATAVISNVMRVNDGRAILFSLTGIDKSKQKPAMTILFYQTNVTSAAANAANNLSDADQLNLLGFHRIVATDWIDYANNSICCFKGANAPQLLLEAASGTKDVYAVCILDAGTPTFAVGDLMFKLGVVQA